MLTLWFDNAVGCKHSSSLQRPAAGESSKTPSLYTSCHMTMMEFASKSGLKTYQWLTALPQIISRFAHPSADVLQFITEVITRLFFAFPQHAIWAVAAVSKSTDVGRSDKAKLMLNSVCNSGISNSIVELIRFADRLFDQLLQVCNHDVKKRAVLKISQKLPELHALFAQQSHVQSMAPATSAHRMLRMIMPIQSALTLSLPQSTRRQAPWGGPSQNAAPLTDVQVFPAALVTLDGIQDNIDVLKSKEMPKKIALKGSDGLNYVFLAKKCLQEARGDMRKNSRLMEFCSVVNRLLKKNSEANRRKLQLRTFAVLPLNEECGLIEWVSDTVAFRNLIVPLHEQNGVTFDYAFIKAGYEKAGKSIEDQMHLLHLLLEKYPPVFSKWFLQRFPEPTSWFQNRLIYCRSAAVWSMVGYVVGLGDRHCENILIDEKNGECVHVDFDCLFDKGKRLEKPELVPFRLTHNFVDALGISGVEGQFRRSCEVTMELLRFNREMLKSVLQTLIHDPLLEWRDNRKPGSSGSGEKDARRILSDIDTKLMGRVISDSLALSVKGQVHQLILEATSIEKLAQMYIGWMSWI